MADKQQAAQWYEQALVDYCNLLPISARQPVLQAGKHFLAILLTEPAPPPDIPPPPPDTQ